MKIVQSASLCAVLAASNALAGSVGNPIAFGTGSGPSRAQEFRVGSPPFTYSPYASSTLPVRVGMGDINRDGIPDIVTGAGPGGGPHVKVFSGSTHSESMSFFPYTPGFTGGVYVAAGDVTGDGFADIVTGAGAGAAGGHVKVFNGQTGVESRSFLSYPAAFTGGVSVASGDVNGDGRADIITGAGAGAAGGHVKVFDGATGSELRSFFAYDGAFHGGVTVASGDINGDGFADIITGAGSGAAGGHVKVFDGTTGGLLRSFFAFDAAFLGGVNVGAGDVDGDGRDDIITGTASSLAHVKVFDGITGLVYLDHLANFGLTSPIDGVYVAGMSVIPAPGAAAAMLLAAGAMGMRRRR